MKIMEFELSVEFKDRFQQAIDENDHVFIKESLDGIDPADITTLLYEFDSVESKYVFDLLPTEIDARILEDLDKDIRENFLEQFNPVEIAGFVACMDSDDGTDMLYDMPVAERNEVIRNIQDEEKASNIMELLRYDEDVAGGLMAKELFKANKNWNVVKCIDEIRKQAENIEQIYSVYVVDNEDTYLGKVSIRKLLITTDDNVLVADIYDDNHSSVETSTTEEEVVDIMQKYDLEAVPVVNARNKLVGRITIDDIVDVIRDNADEERQLMSGVSSDIEEDDTVWKISKARLPWLIIGMAGGLLGAQFLGFFEQEIVAIPALAFFVPLITASGGNVGIQSSSIVVQTLANPSAFEESMRKRLFRALLVAVVNGIVISLIVYGVVLLVMSNQFLALTVSLALFSVVLLASFMGTITPLVLNKFGINPAVASGPFITTANDLLGLAVYFSVAHVLFNL